MGKGNRNRTLGDALKNRKRDDVHESVPTAMPSMTTETVDTQAPEILPTAGQRVVFVWGDVNLIGTPSIPMLFWVTDVNPDSGRVAGYAMPSPTLRAMGPQGQSVAMPPLFRRHAGGADGGHPGRPRDRGDRGDRGGRPPAVGSSSGRPR